MKIFKVIHGYPPHYNAGSEVYSQMLCQALSRKNHEVHVFTREENPFVKDYDLKIQPEQGFKITLHKINIPLDKHHYRYQHVEVDKIFANVLDKIKPDIVHVGHLNHLSCSLIFEIVKRNVPIVYTLHDYWLMCPRGQFIQRNSAENEGVWALCHGQEDKKCARQCYAGYFSGNVQEIEKDVEYWTDWVKRRMSHIKKVIQHVNYFIAPSQYLSHRHISEFGIDKNKIIYLDYGFDLQRLKNRDRQANEPFTFGYIGTHIPAKGIQHLILAFGLLKGGCQLRIWGRPRGQDTEALHKLASSLPLEAQKRIHWLPEYRNNDIVKDVFNFVDCIVVPSIWVENSPLVIHEALQVRVPIITADIGGMSEYVGHHENGLLFEHRNVNSLAKQMQCFVDDPSFAHKLGKKGYLQSEDGNISDLNSHVTAIENVYYRALHNQ